METVRDIFVVVAGGLILWALTEKLLPSMWNKLGAWRPGVVPGWLVREAAADRSAAQHRQWRYFLAFAIWKVSLVVFASSMWVISALSFNTALLGHSGQNLTISLYAMELIGIFAFYTLVSVFFWYRDVVLPLRSDSSPDESHRNDPHPVGSTVPILSDTGGKI